MSKMRVSTIALVILAVVATTLTGCGRRGLIRINGEKIPKEVFYERLQKVAVQTPQGPQLAGRYVIQQMISEKLVEQLAKEEGVAPTEEQIKKKIDLFKRQSGGNVTRALAQQGMTMDEFKEKLMVNQAMINVVTKGISIPDSAVKDAYNKALRQPKTQLIRPPGVKISGIITSSKVRADQAYAMLKSGTEFSTVAMKYTEDELGKQNQGAIGWVSKNMENLPKEILTTAFGLPINEYSKPFKLGKTWVILRADGRRPEKITKYEDIKDSIREQLAMQQGYAKGDVREAMQKFTKKADIVINAHIYKDIGETIKKDASKALEMTQKQGAAGAVAPAR